MKKIYALTIVFINLVWATQAQVTINPDICMVTVDDSSKHNIIYYDKTQFAAVDSFILWRESNTMAGTYTRIMANDSATYSMFLDMDTAGNPNIKLHRYKLQIWHHVNGYSQLGPYHTVLYCLQNVSNYNWNQYDIQGTGTGAVNNYIVLQDDNSTNQWHAIDTVSGSWSSWIDTNVYFYPNGQWRLATMWSISCTPTARYSGSNTVQTAVVKSKSNITNNRTAGINTLKAAGVNLFPNPASEKVTLRFNFPVNESTSIKIYNALGMEMLSNMLPFGKDEFSIPLNGLQKGIYFIEFSNTRAKFTKRLAIE